jgi:hypothetical protein
MKALCSAQEQKERRRRRVLFDIGSLMTMNPRGLKHVGILNAILLISKEEHCAFCWLYVVNWLSTMQEINNIKFIINILIIIIEYAVHRKQHAQ